MNFNREIQSIRSHALDLDYGHVPWDTDIFRFPVAQIDDLRIGEGDAAGAFLRFENWRDEAGVRLVSCRLPHDRLAESMFLEDHGFRFIEMVYSPRLDGLNRVGLVENAPSISPATTSDIVDIEHIAASAFTTGRFLLDRRLDPVLSAERYRVWVRNSFDNERHTVLKATVDGQIAGFFITEDRPDGSVYWHLTAIAPGWQGRGIGAALWKSMMTRHFEAGRTAVETTISGHNAPVLNLYASLGFRFQPPSMTFHWTDGSRTTEAL